MTDRPIIDAGPALNFLAINKERLLLGVLGAVSVPETVRDEVLRKAKVDSRFAAAATVWGRLPERLLHILSDDVTPELAAAVNRISGLPIAERKEQAKDLGEVMVIAHAVVAAETGKPVIIVIDDGGGARPASSEIGRLQRRRQQDPTIGSISLINTITILQRAANTSDLPDRGTMREVYQRLRGVDDGLPPLDSTRLLSPEMWPDQPA